MRTSFFFAKEPQKIKKKETASGQKGGGFFMLPAAGLEPATNALKGHRSAN
jgi:hypothetical protein